MSGRGRPPFNSTLLYKQPSLALRQVIQYADPDPTEATVQGEWFWGATGTQTLAPGLYTNSNTFYAATVTPGAVTLAPARYDNANQFYSPTVTSTNTLVAARYDNTNQFYSPVVTQAGGTQFLLPGLFVNSNQFFQATVSQLVEGGGGSGKKSKSKGWANERRVLELSLEQQEAQETLAKSDNKAVKKIAKRIQKFVDVGVEDEIAEFDALQKEFAKLESKFVEQQLSADLREAAQVLQEFVQDEQDAIDLLILAQDFDARCVIEATVRPFTVTSLMG